MEQGDSPVLVQQTESASSSTVAPAPAGQAETQGARHTSSTALALAAALERYGALLVLIVSVIVFSLLRPQTFPTATNLKVLLISQSILAIISIGLLIPLVAGEFDLSVGFLAGFAGLQVAQLSAVLGWNPYLAIASTLATGTAIGAFNAYLIIRVGISSFIATLGVGTILSGLTVWVSGGFVVYQNMPPELIDLGQSRFLDIQIPVYMMLVIVVVATFVLQYTQLGRHLHAVGGGRDAARMAGLNIDRLIVISLCSAGFLAALTGIVTTANVGAAHPDAGINLLLPAFAAAFLGATTLQPGRFNVPGTIVAIFLLAVLIAGLQQLGAPHWVSPVFNGAALIVAVGLAVNRGRR